MTTHPMGIAEGLYDRLSGQAARLQITPEQLIERLLPGDSPPLVGVAGEQTDLSDQTCQARSRSAPAKATFRRDDSLTAVELKQIADAAVRGFLAAYDQP